MEASRQKVVKAVEQALDIMQEREGIKDDLRDAMKVLSREIFTLRTDPVEYVLLQMQNLTPEQRKYILAEFCVYCGREVPCHCWLND